MQAMASEVFDEGGEGAGSADNREGHASVSSTQGVASLVYRTRSHSQSTGYLGSNTLSFQGSSGGRVRTQPQT